MRLYTQNVDGIDTTLPPLATKVPLNRKAPWPKTVQLHGGLAKMVCSKCHALSEFEAELFQGPVPPPCNTCEVQDSIRTNHAGKRSHGVGKLRPRMVLYNEHNPDDEAIGAVTAADLRARPDAVIVVGTTLKVPGVRRIVKEMCGVTRSRRDGVTVWISSDPEPSGIEFKDCWDLVVRGKCDDVARHAALRKWDDDDIGPYEEVSNQQLQEIKQSTGEVKVVIESPRKERTVQQTQGVITPIASPKIKAWSAVKASQISTIKPQKSQNNPASHGPTIATLLKKASSQNGRAAPRKKAAAPKKATSGKCLKVNSKITTAFKLTKATNPVTSKLGPTAKSHNAESSDEPRDNSKAKPKPPGPLPYTATSIALSGNRKRTYSEISTTVRQTQPMTPIPPEAARHNSCSMQIPLPWNGKLTKYKDDGILSESGTSSVEGDWSPKRSPLMSPIK